MKKALVLVILVLMTSFGYAEAPKPSEAKPYCIECRIKELTTEANKLQTYIQQASMRIEQIKGAVSELQRILDEQEKEVKQQEQK